MCDTSSGCYSRLHELLNYSTFLNNSKREELLHIFFEETDETLNEQKIPFSLRLGIIIIFTLLILFGTFGSSLVIYVILRKKSMYTRGNLFILNLAISDFTLCLITQPFNLLRLLTGNRNWIFGQFMCKFSAMFQGTNIFVSTISITAIALDRFQCIVYPTLPRRYNRSTFKLLFIAWLIAILLASPLAYFSKINKMKYIQCTEKTDNSTTQKLKVIYSVGALLLQYISPLLIVTIVYSRICVRIHARQSRSITKFYQSNKRKSFQTSLFTKYNNNNNNNNNNKIINENQNNNSNKSVNIFCNKTFTDIKIVDCAADSNINNNNNSNNNDNNTNMILNKHTNPLCCITNFKYGNKTNFNLRNNSSYASCSIKAIVDRRHRKAILLLAGISIIFSLSWFPINTMNVISDIRELIILNSINVVLKNIDLEFTNQNLSNLSRIKPYNISNNVIRSDSLLPDIDQILNIEVNNIDSNTVVIIQTFCLLIILSSACLNPILYGWLNENFRQEFYQMFCRNVYIKKLLPPLYIESEKPNLFDTNNDIYMNRCNKDLTKMYNSDNKNIDNSNKNNNGYSQCKMKHQNKNKFYYDLKTFYVSNKFINNKNNKLIEYSNENESKLDENSQSVTQNLSTVYSLFVQTKNMDINFYNTNTSHSNSNIFINNHAHCDEIQNQAINEEKLHKHLCGINNSETDFDAEIYSDKSKNFNEIIFNNFHIFPPENDVDIIPETNIENTSNTTSM